MVPDVHVLSLAPDLSVVLLERILTATEQTLTDLGASRIWMDREGGALRVVAQFADGDALSSPG